MNKDIAPRFRVFLKALSLAELKVLEDKLSEGAATAYHSEHDR